MAGVVQNIIGMVRDINDRRREARVEDAIRDNYLTAPDVAIQQAIKADPYRGLALKDRETERNASAAAAARKRANENTDFMARYLRGAPQGSDYGSILDQQSDFLRQQGIKDEEIGAFKSAIAANPNILAGLDDEAYKAMAKDRFSDTIATPGAYVRRGGETVERVPYAPKAVVVRGGDGSSEMRLFNPNDYLSGSDAGGGANAGPRRGVDPNGPAAAPPGGGVSDDEAGQILGDAMRNKVIGQSDARVIRDSLGVNGGDKYNQWLKENGIRVVPDAAAARAPVAPPQSAAGDLPIQRVQPAPTMRAAPAQSGQRIGAPTAPKPAKRLRPATPEELRGYPPGTAAQIDESTGEMKNLRTPPASATKSPAQQYKELKDQEAFTSRNTEAIETFDRLGRTARDLLNHPGMEGATGNVEGRLPQLLLGQSSVDFQNELEALKSQIGLSQLMKFKAQSSQGASGFGNLSNEEGRRLERAWGTLETTSSAPVFRKNLKEIIDIAESVKRRSQDAMAKGYLPAGGAAPARQGSGPQLGTRIRDRATGRTAILDNSGWIWEDTGRPVGGKKK